MSQLTGGVPVAPSPPRLLHRREEAGGSAFRRSFCDDEHAVRDACASLRTRLFVDLLSPLEAFRNTDLRPLFGLLDYEFYVRTPAQYFGRAKGRDFLKDTSREENTQEPPPFLSRETQKRHRL